MDRKILIAAVIVVVVVCIAAAAVAMSGDDDDDSPSTPSTDSTTPTTPRTDDGGNQTTPTTDPKTPTTDPTTPSTDPTTPSTEGSGHKVLVAYFSGSGRTESVAQKIADATGGTLFEITPQQPYTSADLNYGNSSSRVVQEYNDVSKRDIALTTVTPADWSSYDVVFIGYPIWWGGAAWPVNGFVTGNDFTGKTVIPFCTSASSPIGSSDDDLHALNQTGTWIDGHRFSGSASADTVREWTDSLNLG